MTTKTVVGMETEELVGLVGRVQTGDRGAFDQLFREYEKMVFAIVFRRLRNHASALEVTQDVFVQALRKIGQLKEVHRFPGWLRRIAARMAINRAVRVPQHLTVEEEAGGAPIARDCDRSRC